MKDIQFKGMFRATMVGLACFFASNAWAEDTIHVASAGTLPSLLETAARQVKLTGYINGTDIKSIRERISAGRLSRLDLSDVRIVSGGEAYIAVPNSLA